MCSETNLEVKEQRKRNDDLLSSGDDKTTGGESVTVDSSLSRRFYTHFCQARKGGASFLCVFSLKTTGVCFLSLSFVRFHRLFPLVQTAIARALIPVFTLFFLTTSSSWLGGPIEKFLPCYITVHLAVLTRPSLNRKFHVE